MIMSENQGPGERRLLKALLGPEGPELTCDQCFAELDRYVELELSGGDADSAIPGMRAHLEGCGACNEDHQSLRALVESETGSRGSLSS
jgi:hypothetical protein